MSNIEDFDSNLLEIDKKPYKNIDIYYVGYITIKSISECNSTEEINGNKYLTFASTYRNKEVLKKYTELWDEIKSLIDKIDDKPGEYERDFSKIKFSLDDNLP